MATLNVKNVPEGLYKRLRRRAQRQRRSVSQEVIHILSRATESPRLESILELKGLGKDAWGGIDAADYVARERQGWD